MDLSHLNFKRIRWEILAYTVYNPSGIKLELDYVADTIFHSAPNSCSSFTIRIYGGGSSNIQTLQLIAAIRELNIDRSLFTIEILTCDDVNVNLYLIQDIVKWLLASSVHFITGHIHQGLQLKFYYELNFERTSTINDLSYIEVARMEIISSVPRFSKINMFTLTYCDTKVCATRP